MEDFDFAAAPRRVVYIHEANEERIDVAELSKARFKPVPSDISDATELKRWLDSIRAADVLTNDGWAEIPNPPEASLLQDEFRYHVRLRAPAVDRTREWARTVLQPFPYSVVDLDGLRRALAEPLPLRLPIGQCTYESLDPEISAFFVPHNEYPAESMSVHITGFMTIAHQPGWSESMSQSQWDIGFCNLWCMLFPPADITQISFDMNVTDSSVGSTRPHLMLWAKNRLVVTFEEKQKFLFQAYLDLVRKLENLSAIFFGPVQWIIGVGLAGTQMQVWAVRRGVMPDSLSEELNMVSQMDRVKCLRLSINFLRIALTLLQVFDTVTSAPRPYCRLQTSKYGREEDISRELIIAHPKVLKIIQPWSKHVMEGFTSTEYVRRAYLVRAAQLVSGQSTYSPVDDKYIAVLLPVGYEEAVKNENTLRRAVIDVLYALRALHEADLVHRDVRWKNILRTDDGGWMLIDLETVWQNGEEPSCWLRVWDLHTLDAGMYTKRSDLYLVGKLMEPFTELSAPARALRAKLLDKFYDSAESALGDGWLVGARVRTIAQTGENAT